MSARAIARAALFTAIAGCQRSPSIDTSAKINPNALAAPVPIDHLAKGELLEGPEHAFGLSLPRGIRIDAAFADGVYASGPVPLHSTAQYLRARLQGGDMREGDTSATFEHVRVVGQPERELRIHVVNVAAQVRIEILNTTPVPAPNLPDEKARWKQVGLTPDGHLADPTHLD